MYHRSNSGRYAQVKHMKVKHLVQLVTLTVLFTWFLYQLNSSHKAKVLSRRGGTEDEVGDEMLITFDNFILGVNLDESSDVAREEFIDKKSVKRSRKELRQKDRTELDQIAAEGDIVSDMFLDDSGEGDGDDKVKREERVRRTDEEMQGAQRRAANYRKARRGRIVERMNELDNKKGDDFGGRSDISERQRIRDSVEAARGNFREDGKVENLGKRSLNYPNKLTAEGTPDRTAQTTNLNGSGFLEQETVPETDDETKDLGEVDELQVQHPRPVNETHEGSTIKGTFERSIDPNLLSASELMKSSSGNLDEAAANSSTIKVANGLGSLEESLGKEFNDS